MPHLFHRQRFFFFCLFDLPPTLFFRAHIIDLSLAKVRTGLRLRINLARTYRILSGWWASVVIQADSSTQLHQHGNQSQQVQHASSITTDNNKGSVDSSLFVTTTSSSSLSFRLPPSLTLSVLPGKEYISFSAPSFCGQNISLEKCRIRLESWFLDFCTNK